MLYVFLNKPKVCIIEDVYIYTVFLFLFSVSYFFL